MNKDELMAILPHRGAMLLIDEGIVDDGGIAHGKYTVRGDEWFLDGHFPGNPVVPGVILCEILAQSACVLLDGKIPQGATPYFTGLSSVRFKNPVKPGDTIDTKCSIIKSKAPFFFAEGEGSVNGKQCIKAEFSFAVISDSTP
ncbi:MAG: beta-hydroxyacyl-ACP dehydratase [Oscillospiraceae bacterium]|nr:beta-hydroxyacyl-ACP dehydratase [Oscillospiraceae bacterium]